MRKLKSLAVVLSIMLFMCSFLLPVSAASDDVEVGVLQWNLTLDDGITANFYITCSEREAAETFVEVNFNEEAFVHSLSELPYVSGTYQLSVEIAPAQLTDQLVILIYRGDSNLFLKTYKVVDYLRTVVSGNYLPELQNLARELLHYGAAAQIYWEHNVEDLANAGYESTYVEPEVPTEIAPLVLSGKIPNLVFYGSTMIFESKIGIRFYFIGDVEGCVFECDGAVYTPIEKDEMWYIQIPGKSPAALDEVAHLVITRGDDVASVDYGPMTYLARKINSDSRVSPLLKALYNYYLAAEIYVAELNKLVTENFDSSDIGESGLLISNDIVVGGYMKLTENSGQYSDGGVGYYSISNEAAVVYRNGVVVARSLANDIVFYKISETDYVVKDQIGGVNLQDQDIIYFSGTFTTGLDEFNLTVPGTYLYLNHEYTNSANCYLTMPARWQKTAVQWISCVDDSCTDAQIVLKGESDSAPVGQDFYSVESELILVRKGQQLKISTDGLVITKSATGEYVISGSLFNSIYFPLQEMDYIKIGGKFDSEQLHRLIIPTYYIFVSPEGYVITTIPPDPTYHISGGTISAHPNGWSVPNKLYFSLAENSLPSGGGYLPMLTKTIQLVRGGKTYQVANTMTTELVKSTPTGYYIDTSSFGSYAPQINDVYIISGSFVNYSEGYTLEIATSYIQINADGTISCSTTMPENIISGGPILSASWTGTTLSFTLSDNSAPKVSYTPTSESCVVDYTNRTNIANTSNASITKTSDTSYSVSASLLGINSFAAQTYKIGGTFSGTDGTQLTITDTYITLNADGTATCSADPPQQGSTTSGAMSPSNDGGFEGGALYFTLADNDIPIDDTGGVNYIGEVTANYLGDDLQCVVYINKYDTNAYYMMFDDIYELNDGDYITVEGTFVADDGSSLSIELTYVLCRNGELIFTSDTSTWTRSTKLIVVHITPAKFEAAELLPAA